MLELTKELLMLPKTMPVLPKMMSDLSKPMPSSAENNVQTAENYVNIPENGCQEYVYIVKTVKNNIRTTKNDIKSLLCGTVGSELASGSHRIPENTTFFSNGYSASHYDYTKRK